MSQPATPVRYAPYALLLACVLMPATALFFQYALGYAPCTLCHWQRAPYVIALLLLGSHIVWGKPALRPALFFVAMLMFINAGIAGYHMGVELKWWSGPLTCTGGQLPSDPAAALEQILNTSLVRCDEIPWSFLGLSMAGWNMLIATSLGIYASIAIVRQQRPAHQTHGV